MARDWSIQDRGLTQGRTNPVFASADTNLNFNSPDKGALEYKVPMALCTEAQKFELNDYGQPEWFLCMGRTFIKERFNPEIKLSTASEETDAYARRSEVIRRRLKKEIAENWRFFFGIQGARDFIFTLDEATVPVPGQNIQTYVNHMTGTMFKIYEPLKKDDAINATVKDLDAIERKNNFLQLAQLAIVEKDLYAELKASGLEIKNPLNQFFDLDTLSPYDLKEIKERWKDSLEEASESLLEDIYLRFDMEQMFSHCAIDEVVNNIAYVVWEKNGNYYAPAYIPSEAALVDLDVKDMYGNDLSVWGYMAYVDPMEYIARFPDMHPDMAKDIINMCCDETWEGRRDYFDCWDNVKWFDRDSKKIGVFKLWWIGHRDSRIKKIKNPYGRTVTRTIDDDKEYEPDGNYNKGKERVLGAKIMGDMQYMDIHTCEIVMNKYVMNAGYEPTVFFKRDEKNRPIPNCIQFMNNKYLNMFRSVVSRLKWNQIEKDRLKRKLQKLTDQDLSKNYVIYADKIDANVKEMVEDFEGTHIHIVTGATGEVNDPNNNKKLMSEVIDLSLSPTVSLYIELINNEKMEMAEIANIPPVALGTVSTVQGKAVTESRLTQSTYSTLLFYKNFGNFIMQVLQRTLDYNRANLSLENIQNMPLSVREIATLKYVENFKSADISLYVTDADPTDERTQNIIKDTIFAWNQNLPVLKESGMSPIDPLRFVLEKGNLRRLLRDLEDRQRVGKREAQIEAQMLAKQEQEDKMALEQHILMMQAKMKQLEKDNDIYMKAMDVIAKNPQVMKMLQNIQPVVHDLPEQTFSENGGGSGGQGAFDVTEPTEIPVADNGGQALERP